MCAGDQVPEIKVAENRYFFGLIPGSAGVPEIRCRRSRPDSKWGHLESDRGA